MPHPKIDKPFDGDDAEIRIKQWLHSTEMLNRAQAAVTRAEVDLHNAVTELAVWLVPEDAKDTETFCHPYGDSFITVRKRHDGGYAVALRKRDLL